MKSIYDKFAKLYDRAFQPFENRFLSRWRAEALGLLPENATILELGAGTGANFEFTRTAGTRFRARYRSRCWRLRKPKQNLMC